MFFFEVLPLSHWKKELLKPGKNKLQSVGVSTMVAG
jgi:hypothetical protein